MASPAEDTRLDAGFEAQYQSTPTGESIADLLRRTRESYGQDIGTVAMQLRIRKDYLLAIEEGRFRDLPGATYAVGFVRTYSEYLGLDAPEVLRRFREEVAEVNGQPQLIFPAAAAEGKLPGGAILFLSVLLAALAYGIWYYLSDREMNLLELVPEVPGRLEALVSGGLAPKGGDAGAVPDDTAAEPEAVAENPDGEEGSDAVATSEDEEIDAAEPAVPDESADGATETEPIATSASGTAPAAAEAADAADSVAALAEPASPPPAPAVTMDDPEVSAAIPVAPAAPPVDDTGQVFGAANSDARIVLRARLESWVQVTDASGSTLLTGILRAGDRYMVPDEPGLRLTTGNAGGLDILVDGRAIPSLGPVGVVRRGVALDPERLTTGNALRD